MNPRVLFLLQQMGIPVWEERFSSQVVSELVIVHESPEILMDSCLLRGILRGFLLSKKDFRLIHPSVIDHFSFEGPIFWFAEHKCPGYLNHVLFCAPWSQLHQDGQMKQQLWKRGCELLQN